MQLSGTNIRELWHQAENNENVFCNKQFYLGILTFADKVTGLKEALLIALKTSTVPWSKQIFVLRNELLETLTVFDAHA